MLTAVVIITGLFIGVLLVNAAIGSRLCALCGAVSGTWVTLLVLYHAEYYANLTVIALLIGQSIVGGFYWLDSHAPDRLAVFSLPFLLTGTVVGYLALRPGTVAHEPVTVAWLGGVVALLWLITGVLYTYREDERVRAVFDEMIACCREW